MSRTHIKKEGNSLIKSNGEMVINPRNSLQYLLFKIANEEKERQIKLTQKSHKKSLYLKPINENSISQSQENRDINIRKRLYEIKKNIKDSSNENLLLTSLNNKYFTSSYLNLIRESNTIIKEKIKNEEDLNEKESISNYIYSNKEIILKNNIIKILNNEINHLKHEETSVRRIIKDAENDLDTDLAYFNLFVENEKKRSKDQEAELGKELQISRELQDEKRVLLHSNRHLNDELEKYVKASLNLMTSAYFVSYSLKTKLPSQFIITYFDKNNFEFSSENEIKPNSLVDEIIISFHQKKFEIPIDPLRMILRIKELENEIIKNLEKEENMRKERLKMKEEITYEIENLSKKLIEVKSERDLLDKEYKKVEGSIKKYSNFSNIEQFISARYTQTIVDSLLSIIEGDDDKNSNSKKKSTMKKKDESIESLMSHIKSIENMIITKISSIDYYLSIRKNEVEGFFLKRKEINKENKLKEQKLKREHLDWVKHKKAKERMKRIVIKGKKIINHSNFYDDNKKNIRFSMDKTNKNDNIDILVYHSEI